MSLSLSSFYVQVTEAAAQVVSGRLPSWLRGSLLLNGCGDFRGMQHLFDGYACLSRVRLDGQDNRAWASQRFLDTDAYRWGSERTAFGKDRGQQGVGT